MMFLMNLAEIGRITVYNNKSLPIAASIFPSDLKLSGCAALLECFPSGSLVWLNSAEPNKI